MASREAVDLYLGQPGLEDVTPRPVADDDPCVGCRHPRWMHASSEKGYRTGRCHLLVWESQRACRCRQFVEASW